MQVLLKFKSTGLAIALGCAIIAIIFVLSSKAATFAHKTHDSKILIGKRYIEIGADSVFEARKIQSDLRGYAHAAYKHYFSLKNMQNPNDRDGKNSSKVLVEPFFSPEIVFVARSPKKRDSWIVAILLSDQSAEAANPVRALWDNMNELNWQGTIDSSDPQAMYRAYTYLYRYQSRMTVGYFDVDEYEKTHGIVF